MSVKNQLKKDLLVLAASVNAQRKEDGKPNLQVRFKGNQILINLEGEPEIQSPMDFNLIIYKLQNGENAFAFFADFLSRYEMLMGQDKMDWITVRHFVYPILKPVDQPVKFENPNESGKGITLINEPSRIPNTIILFVVDNPDNMIFLSDKMLADMGITKEELVEEAYQNLNNRFEFDLTDAKLRGIRSFKSNTRDSYDATRILSLDLNLLMEHVGKDYYFIIPERDFLLIAEQPEASKEELISFLSKTARDNYQRSRYYISPSVYQWTGEEVIVVK